ncbi:MAG: hypothetical protein PHP25_03015 [Candidatus Moranbacteria bacterium]|nr:hypothetical protein [Candidatus Moranbacteria bacterium]
MLRTANRILRERKVSVLAEMPWKILANVPAEARSAEAASFQHTIWLRTLNEIRTFFKENPQADLD